MQYLLSLTQEQNPPFSRPIPMHWCLFIPLPSHFYIPSYPSPVQCHPRPQSAPFFFIDFLLRFMHFFSGCIILPLTSVQPSSHIIASLACSLTFCSQTGSSLPHWQVPS